MQHLNLSPFAKGEASLILTQYLHAQLDVAAPADHRDGACQRGFAEVVSRQGGSVLLPKLLVLSLWMRGRCVAPIRPVD